MWHHMHAHPRICASARVHVHVCVRFHISINYIRCPWCIWCIVVLMVYLAQAARMLNTCIHKKYKKDPKDSRPDILHQCLLTLLDSPLNKAGLLKVYIRSNKNVLIDVAPTIRLPRTFKRFAGLMVQLLHKRWFLSLLPFHVMAPGVVTQTHRNTICFG